MLPLTRHAGPVENDSKVMLSHLFVLHVTYKNHSKNLIMNIKTLKKIHAVIADRKPVLDILQYFLIDSEYIQFTSLDLYIRAKHFFPVKAGSIPMLIKASYFLQRMKTIRSPFSITCNDMQQIRFEQPDSVTSLQSNDARDYPAWPVSDGAKELFSLTAYDISIMNVASRFVADDELRPIMQLVNISQHFVVASDAHKLYFRKIKKKSDLDVLFSRKLIKLMMLFTGETFRISQNNRYMFAESDNVSISWHNSENSHVMKGIFDEMVPQSSYPAWRKVLPTTAAKVIIPVNETISILKSLFFASNAATRQAKCVIKSSKLHIYVKDDENEIKADDSVPILNPDNSEITFGMKIDFLLDILKVFSDEGYYQISLAYTDETHAFVFGDMLLCMPMMLNE